MKLTGTAALYEQRKKLEAALNLTNRQIALAEEFEGEGKPEKKTRRGRKAKVNGVENVKALMREQPIPGYIPEA